VQKIGWLGQLGKKKKKKKKKCQNSLLLHGRKLHRQKEDSLAMNQRHAEQPRCCGW
jgi:hypothetical protein